MNTIVNKISNFLYVNSIAFVVIVFITFINGQTHPLVGNFIWLPLGVVSLCYLLFGFRIVIAVFLAIMFSAHWFHEEPLFIFTKNIVHLMGALAPLLAIALMKFFAFSYFDNFSINAVKFIQGYLLGDILGCLTVLFFAALVIVPGIRYFAPQLIPSDIEN